MKNDIRPTDEDFDVCVNHYLNQLQIRGNFNAFYKTLGMLKAVFDPAASDSEAVRPTSVTESLAIFEFIKPVSLSEGIRRLTNTRFSKDFKKLNNSLIRHCKEHLKKWQHRLPFLIACRDALLGENIPDTVVFADKHGRSADLERILQRVMGAVSLKKPLTVVGLGDTFDRGRDNVRNYHILRKIAQIAELQAGIRLPLCIGNHDLMMINAVLLKDKEQEQPWRRCGGNEILKECQNQHVDIRDIALWTMMHSALFHIDQRGFLYVHAGIPLDSDGNPGVSRQEMDQWGKQWRSIQKQVLKIPGFPETKTQKNQLARFWKDTDDLFWIRSYAWIERLAMAPDDIRISIHINAENRQKIEDYIRKHSLLDDEHYETARIENVIRLHWQELKNAGIQFRFQTPIIGLDEDKSNFFLTHMGINGILFGHEHLPSIMNYGHRFFCIDTEDGDSGHILINQKGIWFSSFERKCLECITPMPDILANLESEIKKLSSLSDSVDTLQNY